MILEAGGSFDLMNEQTAFFFLRLSAHWVRRALRGCGHKDKDFISQSSGALSFVPDLSPEREVNLSPERKSQDD